MKKEFFVDRLRVLVCDSREELGAIAAFEAAEHLKQILSQQAEANSIFAAAPSQNEFLSGLASQEGIPWERVRAFHMDEYIGLSSDAPQRFGQFLFDHIFSLVPFYEVNYINSMDETAIEQYAEKLKTCPVDVCYMGIGENGHIAFNDPGVADMFDPEWIKTVGLDNVCREQQVHDSCFASIDQVPVKAVTLTVPTLLRAKRIFCMVPAETKAEAVRKMLTEPIGMSCPASVLRLHENATLYLEPNSAKLVV